jgi:hypothetical protein
MYGVFICLDLYRGLPVIHFSKYKPLICTSKGKGTIDIVKELGYFQGSFVDSPALKIILLHLFIIYIINISFQLKNPNKNGQKWKKNYIILLNGFKKIQRPCKIHIHNIFFIQIIIRYI